MNINKLFKKVRTEMQTLNNEYEALSKVNNLKSKQITSEINEKKEKFLEKKNQTDRHFDTIRNKKL
jgi:hypothetical protein